MTYCFCSIPMKKAIKPGWNNSIKTPATLGPQDLLTLEALRNDMMTYMDSIRERFEKQQHRSFIGSDAQREEVMKTLTTKVDMYVSRLFEVVTTSPVVGSMQYYFWGSSVSERLNHAFDDFRYDVSCLYFNVAVAYHELAKFVLELPAGSPITDGMEKEGYSHLGYAAGYMSLALTLAQDMQASPSMTSKNAMIEDAKVPFLEALLSVFLLEGQWIGAEKAIRNELNKNKEIVPKLTHRAFDLAKTALEASTKKLNCSTPAYKQLVRWIDAQCAVLELLVYAQTAPCRFDGAANEGLWFAKRAEELVPEAMRSRSRLDDKAQAEWALRHIKAAETAIDRIHQINNLVTRERPGEGPYALPPSQELARCKPVAFPRPVPAVASVTKPSDTLPAAAAAPDQGLTPPPP